jgi:hypothetical protein
MTKSPQELLSFRAGRHTVADNLRRAVDSGALIEDADGGLRFAQKRPASSQRMVIANGPVLGCDFLFDFLFTHAYGKAAVPSGCSSCYKVKVIPRTLRELVAATEVAKGIQHRSKWGVDIDNPHTQTVYGGYFYVSGLEMARAVYKVVREALDAHPKLGPDVGMLIKRACTEYEIAVGPSDQFEFAPEQEALEAHLKSRFSNQSIPAGPAIPLAHWIDAAFRIGDDTYLDFTRGKRLRPQTVSYEP